MMTDTNGVPVFLRPKPDAFLGTHVPAGSAQASFYSTEPLRDTLSELVNFNRSNAHAIRMMPGAVHARSGPFLTGFLTHSSTMGLQIRQKLGSPGPILATDAPSPTGS